MICIECANENIECLYSKYKSEYIKLTICPKCGKVADRYIEFDNVLLFIDILLLKTQAYRHLAFNVTETEMLKDEKTHVDYEFVAESTIETIRSFIHRYKPILRLILMIILFEVYLMWAYEEKKPNHSLVVSYILQQKIHNQYLYFITKLFTQQFYLNGFIILLFRLCGWGKQQNKQLNGRFQLGYFNLVLLVTVLVSSSIKLFPILMLIWPYDKTAVSSPLINFIGFVILLESLKIVTSMRYSTIFCILLVSTIGQLLMSRLTLLLIINYFTEFPIDSLLHNEYLQLVENLQNYKDLLAIIRENINL